MGFLSDVEAFVPEELDWQACRWYARHEQLNRHCYFLREVLEFATMTWLLESGPKPEVDRLLRLHINGRVYWFRSTPQGREIPQWVTLLWPMDQVPHDIEIPASKKGGV